MYNRYIGVGLLVVFCTAMLGFVVADSVPLTERYLFLQKHYDEAQDHVIQLDSRSYEWLAFSGRNYTLAVMFNALSPTFSCPKCKDMDLAWKDLSNTWSSVKHRYSGVDLYFATVNFFEGGQEAFKSVGEGDPPTMYFLTPKTSTPSRVTIRHGIRDLYQFLEKNMNIQLPMKRTFQYVNFLLFLLFMLFAIALLKIFFNPLLKIFGSFKLWASISMALVVIMSSGQMWNHVRSPPYAGQDNKRVQIILPQFQSQYAIESQIIAAIYAFATLALISLYVRVPESTTTQKQRILGWISLALFVFVFNLGIGVFRQKGMGYPFSLLF
jgi:oligosaccharyltransferase complex subunit gamma